MRDKKDGRMMDEREVKSTYLARGIVIGAISIAMAVVIVAILLSYFGG